MRERYAQKIENARVFTDTEAWNLFRLAAFGEAFGWTLLISSLVFKHYVTPGNNIPIDIAGQIHGTLFLIYIAAVVVLHLSLRWSPRRTLIAGLVSVPPYGTLIFEQWAARRRHSEVFKTYRQLVVRAIILQKGEVLALQPQDSGFWYLPGGLVAEESAEAALKRLVTEQTGIPPTVGNLLYVWQHGQSQTQQMELFFMIVNAKDYQKMNAAAVKKGSSDLDELGFITPSQRSELRPQFLQTVTLPKSSTTVAMPVKFI
jgi:integral membrane protein